MKIAVIGLGFMGTTHLKSLAQAPGVELAAVFDRSGRRLAGDFTGVQGNLEGPAGAIDLSGARKYGELDALLRDPNVEAVDICLPTFLHESTAVQALRAGKHVLVEKPIALDERAAARMIEEAERHQRILMTAHVLRFFPAYIALRAIVRGETGGGLRYAEFRRRCATPQWGEWLRNPAQSGGGAFDLLIHDADMCLHLFGPPAEISAAGYVDAAGVDCLSAQLFYSGGAAVSITGGWHHPGAYPFSMEYTVTLENGTVDYSSAGRAPAWYGRDASHRLLDLETRDGYAAEIAYFAECCRAGRAPDVCPPRESAAAVKLMLLLLEARGRNGERMACNLGAATSETR